MLWSKWWESKWHDTIRLYERLEWKIIAINKGTKRPVAQTAWATEPGLDARRMIDYTTQGFNLAVVAGPSGIAALDYDSKDMTIPLEQMARETMTMRTPRGFCFVTKEPYSNKAFLALKKKLPGFESARVNILYELVPLSKTCTRDHAPEHECTLHDYRIREWLRPASFHNIIPFKEFCKAV